MNKTTTENSNSILKAVPASDFSGVKVQLPLLRQVVVGLQANKHQATAHTKKRGEVSGGGRKPWRQKGTGRARVGSSRTPVWRGGGIVFGPSNTRNFSHILPVAFRRQAVTTALAIKAHNGQLYLAELASAPTTTKEALKAIPDLLGLRKTLLVVPDQSYIKPFRNLDSVNPVIVNNLNALDIVNFTEVVFVGEAYKSIRARIGK